MLTSQTLEDALCHSKWYTLESPHCSMVISARIGHLTFAASSAMVTSPYEGRVLDKERKNQTNNFFLQKNKRNEIELSALMWRENNTREFEKLEINCNNKPDLFPNAKFGFNGRQLLTTAVQVHTHLGKAYNLENNWLQPPGS